MKISIKKYKELMNDERSDRLIQYHAKKGNFHKLPGVISIRMIPGGTRSVYQFTFRKGSARMKQNASQIDLG